MRKRLTALVFKIQANMDPNNRDRMAFARVCSGRLERGMKLKQVRTGKAHPAERTAVLLRPRPRVGRGERSPAMWWAFPTTARCASAIH